jgi:hypothetical protein
MNLSGDGFKDPYNPTPEELKAFYEKAKREFCMEDLRIFEDEPDPRPFSELVAELAQMLADSKKGDIE